MEPVYGLLNFISFPHERTNFLLGDSRVERYQLSLDWRFIASPNSRKPGYGLFKIPKNCSRRDFKLTRGEGGGVRTLLAAPPPKQHSHANPAIYAGYLTVVASVQ